MYSVWILQLMWILKGVFQIFSLFAAMFVCELSICMEIDQSPRFTRRVVSFQTVVLSQYGLEDPFSLLSAHFCHFFQPFATAPSLYHCTLSKKKEKNCGEIQTYSDELVLNCSSKFLIREKSDYILGSGEPHRCRETRKQGEKKFEI